MDQALLINLRSELDLVSKELFSVYAKRLEVIREIQMLKKEKGLGIWDPYRELELFKSLEFCNNLSMAASYSLLLETQARSFGYYPAWSEAEHIADKTGTLLDFINPVLLFSLNESQYSKIKLHTKYKLLVSEVLKNE